MIKRVFLDHPATVDETFFQHLWFALRFSFSLFVAAGAALIHAFIPCLCQKTASRLIEQLHARMHNRQS